MCRVFLVCNLDGIRIADSPGNSVSNNQITGNRAIGVVVEGDSAVGNSITSNYIGVDFYLTEAIPIKVAVHVQTEGNVFGGADISGHNTIYCDVWPAELASLNSILPCGGQFEFSDYPYVRVDDEICGNGRTDDKEECDDANLDNEDACLDVCLKARCGDGLVWKGMEECDDENQVNTDGCTNSCRLPACGDGFVQAGEVCDDGNVVTEACPYGQASCTVCGAGCKWAAGAGSYCGDTKVDTAAGEKCDDGNTSAGDGCGPNCLTEAQAPIVEPEVPVPPETELPATQPPATGSPESPASGTSGGGCGLVVD